MVLHARKKNTINIGTYVYFKTCDSSNYIIIYWQILYKNYVVYLPGNRPFNYFYHDLNLTLIYLLFFCVASLDIKSPCFKTIIKLTGLYTSKYIDYVIAQW